MKKAAAKDKSDIEVKMELKYCERCGALGVRQCGTEEVYCDHCVPEVAELPPAKKGPGRLVLPVQPRTLMEEYELDDEGDVEDFEGSGGAA